MMLTPKIYGAPPQVVGTLDIEVNEMMFWLYLPVIKRRSYQIVLPKQLAKYWDIVQRCRVDYDNKAVCDGAPSSFNKYVYLTAKTIYVTPEAPGNRPGWHSDGFLTDDVNYIWYDTNPTLFWEPSQRVAFTSDHQKSLPEMALIENDRANHVAYPPRTILRLDQTVMHRVGDVQTPGVRTFVKISISDNKYALKGNSINHDLGGFDAYADRNDTRNNPSG